MFYIWNDITKNGIENTWKDFINVLDYKTQVSTRSSNQKKCIDIYKYSILLD